MKRFSLINLLSIALFMTACAQQRSAENVEELSGLPEVINDPANYNDLSEQEAYVILNKGTEYAFSGAFYDYKEDGVYICKQCNNPLFSSNDKFNSGTGWPSFDDMIADNVKEQPDGSRTEIVCANCGGHLGHVFRGEGFTDKGLRHCVNSASLNFVPAEAMEEEKAPKNTDVQPVEEYVAGKNYGQYERAVFAGGCFWCTEAAFERIEGVEDVISGYSGGEKTYPTYEQVSYGRTKHAEAIIVFYNPDVITYETLLEIFFTAHDPTQLNRQGPDVGPQYRSAIFYLDEEQHQQAKAYIKKLDVSGEYGKSIVTELSPYDEFWVAEGYHQDYYVNNPGNPYVQRVSKPKVQKVEKKFKDRLKKEYRP